MSRSERFQCVLRLLQYCSIFFLLIAFITTCCIMLFTSTMMRTLDITPTEENINEAAKATFVNVILLTLLITVIEITIRKFTMDIPTQRITEAAEKIIQGNFDTRISATFIPYAGNFNKITQCFNQMAQELSGMETLRMDFIASVSHELKTPLAVMQNYGTMLQQPDLPEAKRIEYAKTIAAASRRLTDLVSNILRLNKLENQHIMPSTEAYNLTEQLCECLIGFENVWEQKQISIETDIQDDIMVRTDAEMMTLVWNNLFSNAIKFTDKGGTVALSLKAEEDMAVVRVRDTGCGISPETGARIFDKFYQGDTSRATQGNGLGLALVKRVIDLTGSDISVESEVGKGSTFTVKIRRYTDGMAKKYVE